MPHPYPRHDPRLPYTGKHRYFLTFSTAERRRAFADGRRVPLVLTQFLRAAAKWEMEITAYCFMPDHVHLLVRGLSSLSDCRAFIKAAKQYSAYHSKQQDGRTLWQRYGYEHVIRDDMEHALTIEYIIANPVQSGLVMHPSEYPFLGSQRYTLAELLAMCEYGKGM